MTVVTSVEQLNALYGEPGEASIVKVTDHLLPEYRRMIEASPFLTLATVGPEGLDCSPRGDAGAVIHIEDARTLMLPDWRGNNRVDSLANIVRDPRVALLFLIPGSNTTMRVNGRAVLRADLWNPEKFADTACLPTVGQMLASAKKGFDGEAYDREWPGRAAKTMW